MCWKKVIYWQGISYPACLTTQWEKYVQRPSRKELATAGIIHEATDDHNCSNKDVHKIAAKIHFFNIIQEELNTGSFEDISYACQLQKEIFSKFAIKQTGTTSTWDRATVKKKLVKNLNNVGIKSCGNQGSQVFSLENVEIASKSCKKDVKDLLNAAQYLGRIIQNSLKSSKWKFDGSLDNHIDSAIPTELNFFMQWLIQGTKIEHSEYKKCVNNACHSVIQNFKTDRQACHKASSTEPRTRSRTETPTAIAMSLHSYYLYRSKSNITFLHKASVGVSYDRVKAITNEIATEERYLYSARASFCKATTNYFSKYYNFITTWHIGKHL